MTIKMSNTRNRLIRLALPGRREPLNLDSRPETVNTDGWSQTQAAWRTLFPGIQIVLCFLHAVLRFMSVPATMPEEKN